MADSRGVTTIVHCDDESSSESEEEFVVDVCTLYDDLDDNGDDAKAEETESCPEVTCPVCQRLLSEVADTESAQWAHVNDCLDTQARPPSPRADAADLSSSVAPRPACNAQASTAPQRPAGCPRVFALLEELQLTRFAEDFAREEVDFEALLLFTEDDLKARHASRYTEVGVTALGPRLKLLGAIAAARGAAAGTSQHHEQPPKQPSKQPPPALPLQPLDPNSVHAVLAPRAMPPEASASRKRAAPVASAASADAAGAAAAAPSKRPATGGGGRGGWGGRARAGGWGGRGRGRGGANHQADRPVPTWKLVPGTPFVVDGFGPDTRGADCRNWFLTHFHQDHWQGLSKTFNRGTIVCSGVTARLVTSRLGVNPGCIRVLPLHHRVEIEGVGVTFLEANHCPGAVMILFEPPPPARAVLHTGDFRYRPDVMGRYEQLFRDAAERCGGGGLHLVLDTTYCGPEHSFPSQDEAVRFVADTVRAEASATGGARTLFLFGTYTIGKERVFLEAARAAGAKVYAGAAKRSVLSCLDLSPEDKALITESDEGTNFHAVPMACVSFKRMGHISAHYRGRYDTVVGFAPSGFGAAPSRSAKHGGRKRQKGSFIIYSVPYSEHSSFDELRAFVRWLRPAQITPSVGNTSEAAAAEMVARLLG